MDNQQPHPETSIGFPHSTIGNPLIQLGDALPLRSAILTGTRQQVCHGMREGY